MGLVYEHMSVEPMVVQKLDAKATLLVYPKGEEVEKICSTLQFLEKWLGHSVKIGCDVATPEQVSVGDQLQWVEREEVILAEDVHTQVHRSMQEPK